MNFGMAGLLNTQYYTQSQETSIDLLYWFRYGVKPFVYDLQRPSTNSLILLIYIVASM
jgi:hypothetical protein